MRFWPRAGGGPESASGPGAHGFAARRRSGPVGKPPPPPDPRAVNSARPGSHFVNVAPDGKGGGVWVDVNAPPIPVLREPSLPGALLPPPKPADAAQSVTVHVTCDAPCATRTRAHVRPAGTYR